MGVENLFIGLAWYVLAGVCLALSWAIWIKYRLRALGAVALFVALLSPFASSRQITWLVLGALGLAWGFRQALWDALVARLRPQEPWRQSHWDYQGEAATLQEALRGLCGPALSSTHATLRWALAFFLATLLLFWAGDLRDASGQVMAWHRYVSAAVQLTLIALLIRHFVRKRRQKAEASTEAWAGPLLRVLENAHPQSPVVAGREGRDHEGLPAWQQKGVPLWDEVFGSYRRYVRYLWWHVAFLLPNRAVLKVACFRAVKVNRKRAERGRDRWQLQVQLRWPPRSAPPFPWVEEGLAQAPAGWVLRAFPGPQGAWALQGAYQGDRLPAGQPDPAEALQALLAWLESLRLRPRPRPLPIEAPSESQD